jgi:O-antigen/teichoic acid export membrane protein
MAEKDYSNRAFGRGVLHYTLGRGGNAVLGFVIFALIVRYFSVNEYALYVAALACLELTVIVFGFGMEWMTSIFIPQIKLKGNGHTLTRFIWQCVAIQGVMLACGALLMALFAHELASGLGFEEKQGQLFFIYALVVFVEGMNRVFRDQLLSCLLQQGAAQLSHVARNLVLFFFALQLSIQPQWCRANILALVELCASFIGLVCSAMFLLSYLRGQKQLALDSDWKLPAWSEILKVGHSAWLGNLAYLVWGGGAIVILIVTRLMGAEVTAMFGFTRNLVEQVRRYLPMVFLFGVTRPMLIANYAKNGDVRQLSQYAGLMYRINLLFLLPLLALAISKGDHVCEFLSNGRYKEAHWLLVGWLSIQIFWAHHWISELLAHTLQRSSLSMKAHLILIPTFFLVVVAAQFQEIYVLCATLAMTELAYSVIILARLGVYHPDWSGIMKLLFLLLPAVLVSSLPVWLPGAWSLAVQGMLGFVVVMVGSWLLKAWSREEMAVLSLPWKRFFGWFSASNSARD